MKKILIIIGIAALMLTCTSSITVTAQDQEDLIEQYAPILYFEGEETCYPVEVEYHISNSYLYLIGQSTPIDESPTPSSISNYTIEGFYLDNQKGAIKDNGIISHYQNNNPGYTVYAQVIESGSQTTIQYWMFYAFNPGTLNQHEGDWEMVQVVLSNNQPSQVMYSQHHSGQKASWNQVERQGTHMKVYVARGSHANYFRSYSGVIGIANDIVGANGKVLNPSSYDLELLESQPWLNYAGHWGWIGPTEEEFVQASILGQNGPPGPKYREDGEMWNAASWGAGLLPVNDTVFMLEFVLYHFVTIFLIISLFVVALSFYRIYKRQKTTGLGPRIISMLYIDGINNKSIGNLFCIAALIIAIIGLFQPWYLVSTDIGVSGYETNGMEEMLRIDGLQGVQIQFPGFTGPIPIGSVAIPFSLLIGISLVFLIIATIGVSHSKKLGKTYLYRGIRLVIPIIMIIVVIMILGSIPFESFVETSDTSMNINQIIDQISSSPFGGQQSISIPDVNGNIQLQWGIGFGAILLLLSGILLFIGGILEQTADVMLYKSNKNDSTL